MVCEKFVEFYKNKPKEKLKNKRGKIKYYVEIFPGGNGKTLLPSDQTGWGGKIRGHICVLGVMLL